MAERNVGCRCRNRQASAAGGETRGIGQEVLAQDRWRFLNLLLVFAVDRIALRNLDDAGTALRCERGLGCCVDDIAQTVDFIAETRDADSAELDIAGGA